MTLAGEKSRPFQTLIEDLQEPFDAQRMARSSVRADSRERPEFFRCHLCKVLRISRRD